MDLITEPWLPVIDRHGLQKKIAVTELMDSDILDVVYPRADFQGAAWQFLIGLMQCTVAPDDAEDWEEIWLQGFDATSWKKAISSLVPAMQFGPQKPAFLQSFEPLDGETSSVAGLLIDAPGGNTLKLNKDHFVKRDVMEQICPHCAVMALFALQTNSPAGGVGYRVSLRGGGPLTTLLVPLADRDFPLWQKLWMNVLPQEELPEPPDYPNIFPWLTPTKTSEKAGNKVTPENAHQLQAYWGMPRRIELDFAHTRPGVCDLCGEYHEELLYQMRVKNYGVQYDNWIHPLSPYRQALKDSSSPWLSLKGQPGGLSYKDWLGLIVRSEDKFNRTMPAQVIRNRIQQKHTLPPTGLWCFAWDMDNAKARCWYQQRIPLINSNNPEKLHAIIQQIVLLASTGLQLLKNQLKSAWFETPKEAKIDFSMTDIAFWQETEAAFRILLDALIPEPECREWVTRQAIRDWEKSLHSHLVIVFDREVITDPDCPDDILLRQIKARRELNKDYGKLKLRKEILELAKEQKENAND